MLSKLEFYCVNGKSKLWYKLYLSNSYQRVLITNTKLNPDVYSTWGRIRHGVLQGSILGPLLFLLCINDLLKIMNDKYVPIWFTDYYDNLHQKINTIFHGYYYYYYYYYSILILQIQSSPYMAGYKICHM
jgi:hypothetical protein